ncbi:hypothetical protein SpAn4DRAFT_3184 [Sporomusa ovata]|uniref:Uncharacterized protein n=1 Tax=Sporomusa ovata TaxID=2378 RepID=A0A0U1L1E5_9FIRM|nr:hypothetical protein SpAn4DRAFT_3184 [Sporomusa ovata]
MPFPAPFDLIRRIVPLVTAKKMTSCQIIVYLAGVLVLYGKY